ncbi:histidine kinase [Rhizobiaceae bacterium n13]|uniref:histidine kinase n=1 Tax=Ferirhizobium litorale TaxID=2927786 RepID=A0AAE3QCV3_9HYPH|nr:HWE histidine kinase domain-containing protein [Fererhizobium litorale]MDI7863658.1 histidine kinase [Fererhizobium litorale]MDI7923372.1 histidine kinase [Fererhizobium litorale]
MNSNLYFIQGNGDAASEIRGIDWSKTPLGDPGDWPSSLKTAVQMMLASRFPKAITWGPEFITLYNDAFRPILGDKKECMGKPFNVIWQEAWSEIGPIAAKAYGGEATFIEDFPLVIERFGFPEQCYFTFCYSPIRDDTGKVAGMMDTVIEVTGKVETEKNAAILNAELAHRIKNTFSVVQAIASQTFRASADRQHLQTFAQRLSALANAQEVLLLGKNSGGPLNDVMTKAVTALNVADRVALSGPPIVVGPRCAMSTSLLVHELTTNAIKYGALSSSQGTVSINWFVDTAGGEKTLTLRWLEEGGPRVMVPRRNGFGSKLIKMGLMGNGNVQLHFHPQGLEAIMAAPLEQIQGEGRLFSAAAQ